MNPKEVQELAAQYHAVDVTAQRVARVYAEALLQSAVKQGAADAVLEELDSLVGDLFAREPLFETFLASSAIDRRDKTKVLQDAFKGRANEVFYNFLMVLNAHDRLELLRPVLAEYRELNDQRLHRVRVQVRSAVPLAEDQRGRLTQELRETLHVEPILEEQVDPSLLGGLTVRVGDWLYDGSVRTQLDTIRNQLITRSSHEIQSGRDRFSSPVGD
jgi:F-type H+-transporting ATPase subunit delta